MSVPVIGQIRSLQDAQRALENIRSWFLTYTGQQVSTETVNTIVQRTISSTANNNALLKSANLSDVASPTLAFDRIKQAATPSYAGVMRFAQSIEAINGEATDCAVTPAGVKAHVDSTVPVSLFLRCRLADLSLTYMPLSTDRKIPAHLANGDAVLIPCVTGA